MCEVRPRERMSGTSYARLLVVYDADGSLVGEVSYIVGHALGLRECAACDITHRPFSLAGKPRDEAGWEKPAWRDMKARLPMPVVQLHRDELLGERARELLGVQLPVVAGEHEDGRIRAIVSADELGACRGSVEALEALVRAALDTHLPPVTACRRRKPAAAAKATAVAAAPKPTSNAWMYVAGIVVAATWFVAYFFRGRVGL